MSIESSSRMTLADLIPLISRSDLPKAKKLDIASAVRAIGKALGAELADIPAEPGLLRRRLDMISPEAIGFSPRRWANIRSLLARALELARPLMPSRSYAPISAAWEALLAGLNPSAKERVKPLLRNLSEHGVEPHMVTLEILHEYRDAILNDRLRGNAEKTWDHLLWLWNRCVRSVIGWPQVEIPRESKRETYGLQWSDFPASLKEEADRFIERQTGRDLSDDGPPKPWSQSSCKTRLYQLRIAASVLVHQGMAANEIASLSVLTRFENYQKILRFFYDRHDQKTSSQIAGMAAFLKDVAKYWVKVDEDELTRLKKLASKLAIPRQGMTAKNRERLRLLDDPEKVDAFLDLPYRIRREMDKARGSARNRAVQAQIAVAVLILQMAPIRLKNLSQIDINKHLIARGAAVYLVIDGSEVKNGEPIDFELPETLVEMLVWYIQEHRPHLLKQPTDTLFPGAEGAAKSKALLGSQISKTILRYTGMAINPHLFRHAGGKMFLDINPGQYEVVRRVLGHRSMATTTGNYTGAETRSAGQHFASAIAQRREAKKAASTRLKPQLSKAAASLLKPKGGRS
jgi:integrase